MILIIFCIGCGHGRQYYIQNAGKFHSLTSDSEVTRHPNGKSHRFELHHDDFWQYIRKNVDRGQLVRSNRTEVHMWRTVKAGSTHWYGYSMMIAPESDSPSTPMPVKLGQWHTEYNGMRGGMPEIKNNWSMHGFEIKELDQTVKVPIKKGKWTDFIYQFKFGRKGFANIWVNGKQVMKHEGIITTVNDIYFKYGIYASWGLFENDVYIIYYDEYRHGNSYEEVEPSRVRL